MKYAIEGSIRGGRLIFLGTLLWALYNSSDAFGQLSAGDPGPNQNIVGLTIDPADIRDVDSRQQNEPSCAIRPGNPACMICGFNDYRTVDVFGDGWQGVSQTCDGGDNWLSRIAPGHPNYVLPLDAAFAADPRMIAIPGMAIFNFIAGFRDTNRGVVAVQHWLEVNKEDADHYEPDVQTYLVEVGSDGRFLDKPDALAVMDPIGQQGVVTLSSVMENTELGTIVRDYPSGLLYVAYAVVTGSGNFKVEFKVSDDWGQTWTNRASKLSEDQNLVSGISLTAIGDTVLATWRRVNDNNDFDSIMYSFITQRGKKATKAEVLADICTYDQFSNASPFEVSFRTNNFPWSANDSKNFYIFYSQRELTGGSVCSAGRPRIVMNYANALDRAWQSSPMVIDENAPPASFQFMPAAFGARGKIQIAWYDTRRELPLPPDIQNGSSDPDVVADYISSAGSNVFRKVDVFSTRISSDENGNILPIPDPVRVSQFRIAAEVENGELGGKVAIEGEALFPNKKMYSAGQLPFLGDYITVAAEEFRIRQDGKTESNASPLFSPLLDKIDFLVAWTDTRDVRGDILSLDAPMPWSPPVEQTTSNEIDKSAPEGQETLYAKSGNDAPPTGPPRERSSTAEGLEGSDLNPQVCVPGSAAFDRARDSNIYGSVIKDRLRLYSPTPTKPMNSLQRAFAVGLANPLGEEKTFRLEIAGQPGPCSVSDLCRASFRQQPSVPPFSGAPPPTAIEFVTVSPQSSAFRTVFMTAVTNDAKIIVNAFDTDCTSNPNCDTPLSSITLGGNPDLQNPDYVSELCSDADDPECDVLRAELHNPALINPALINPALINPALINPALINPALINPALINYYLSNPALINPFLINPALINYNLENPALINPALINPALINTTLENAYLVNPALINPALINSTLGDGSLEEDLTWTDYNFVTQNTGNITTAYDADITLDVPGGVAVDTQLIAWTPSITTTSLDCEKRFQVESVIHATVNNPDDNLDIATIDNPFAGEVTGIAGAGETLIFTLRVFGTPAELAAVQISGFTAASQAANCSQDVPAGETGDWFCEVTLADERERIVLDIDTTGPTFDGLMNGQTIPVPAQEANVPGGACLDPVATGIVGATDDSGGAVDISCVNAAGDAICLAANGGNPLPAGNTELSLPVSNLLSDPSPGGSPMTCTATDENGNQTVVNVLFEVLDTSAPFFTSFPTNPTVIEADPVTGTAVYDISTGFEAEDVDGVDPNPVISCTADTTVNPADPLPAGISNVSCRVTDASGYFSESSYVVQVNDVTFPVVTVNGANPQIVEAGYPYTELGASATDNVGVSGSVVIDAGTVNTAVTGTYIVTYTATDGAGNTTIATRNVNVVDTTPPDFTELPIDITISANADGTAVVSFSTPGAIDNAGAPTINCAPPSGSVFSVGMTSVTCTATDGSGNSSSVTFDVIVLDTTPPIIVLLGDNPLTLEVGDTYVEPGFSAIDNVGLAGPVVVTGVIDNATPAAYTLTYSAADAAGNATSVLRSVIYTDTTSPTLQNVPADIVEEAVAAAGNAVTYTPPTATDNSSAGASVVCSPASGSVFPLGTTVVTCTATDGSGNSSGATFNVTAQDTTLPVVSVPSAPVFQQIDGPAGSVVDYSALVSATDNIDAAPDISCTPASGGIFAPGDTTVSCTARDDSGNEATATFVVSVGYSNSFGIDPNKISMKSGSSNTLSWGWQDEFGNNMDTSAVAQLLSIVDCDDSENIIVEVAGDPGSSGFRVKVDLSWEFNFQADDEFGVPLPNGQYCASVTSDLTGQMLESPPIRVR